MHRGITAAPAAAYAAKGIYCRTQKTTLISPGKATRWPLPVGYLLVKGRQSPRAAALAACCRARLQLGFLPRCVRSPATHCWPVPQLHQAAPGCCQCSPARCCCFRCSHRPALPQLLPRPKPRLPWVPAFPWRPQAARTP